MSDKNNSPEGIDSADDEPTIVYVPIDDEPLSAEEAEGVPGFHGFALVVERGPRAGMSFVLPDGQTTVGRHPTNDIFLDDVTISRQHCRLLTEKDRLTVEDSGSTNGTYVNEERVDRAELNAGDEVLVGRFRFVVAHGDG